MTNLVAIALEADLQERGLYPMDRELTDFEQTLMHYLIAQMYHTQDLELELLQLDKQDAPQQQARHDACVLEKLFHQT